MQCTTSIGDDEEGNTLWRPRQSITEKKKVKRKNPILDGYRGCGRVGHLDGSATRGHQEEQFPLQGMHGHRLDNCARDAGVFGRTVQGKRIPYDSTKLVPSQGLRNEPTSRKLERRFVQQPSVPGLSQWLQCAQDGSVHLGTSIQRNSAVSPAHVSKPSHAPSNGRHSPPSPIPCGVASALAVALV